MAVALVAVAVFSGALGGDFVYDDTRQIVDNPLIQEGRHLGRALTSDVWAFKGDGGTPVSSYWRPLFVLWLAANHTLFGLGATFGWHLALLLAHAAVTLLAWLLVRRLAPAAGGGAATATAVALLFAVHPVHVESVAWISGAPDVLMAAAFLGALVLVVLDARAPRRGRRWLAAGLALAAMLAKEVAVVFPAVAAAAVVALPASSAAAGGRRWRRAAAAALPGAVAAALYLAARWAVLGGLSAGAQQPGLGWPDELASAPAVLGFYLRQVLWPASLSPAYPLRTAAADSVSAATLWLPLAALAAAAAVIWWVARRRPEARLGVALFLLPLAPALHLRAFTAEQIVHDRYLYLPLLGALMVAVPAVEELAAALLRRWPRRRAAAPAALVLALAGLAAVPLALTTVRYSRVWGDEVRLWRRAVAADPASPFNWLQLGVALGERGSPGEARRALDRSLGLSTRAAATPHALLARADLALAGGDLAAAENDLQRVLAGDPERAAAYERLARVYTRAGRLAAAAGVLEGARQRLPQRRCALTANLAVVLYLQGDRRRALAELEAVQPLIRSELGPVCASVAFRLGQLYAELGRDDEARRAFAEYLGSSRAYHDADSREFRGVAAEAVADLR